MASIYDVDPNELIDELKEELKKIPDIAPPEWALFVKTGVHKERPPVQEDWWFTRSAALLRTIKMRGPIGVSKLRTKYGGKKNRGHKPEHFYKGSGAIVRKILQQLEKAELIKQVSADIHKGRVTTPNGDALLNRASAKRYHGQKQTTSEKVAESPKPKTEHPVPKEPKQKPEAKHNAAEHKMQEQDGSGA